MTARGGLGRSETVARDGLDGLGWSMVVLGRFGDREQRSETFWNGLECRASTETTAAGQIHTIGRPALMMTSSHRVVTGV